MSWRYEESKFGAGDVVTPHELNREFGVVAEEMNGRIDRDNLGAVMTDAKFRDNTFNLIRYDRSQSDITHTHDPDTDTSFGFNWKEGAVVGDPSDPFVTPDCALVINAGCQFKTIADTVTYTDFGALALMKAHYWLGIMVDDTLVAASERVFSQVESDLDVDYHPISLQCYVPVAGGAHRITLVYRIALADEAQIMAGRSVIQERELFVRGVLR